MSETDSFIDEVTEEVRRDRLFGLLRRYGWIAALVIVGIVGAAAYNEYAKSRDRAAAQRLGDQILAALEQDAPPDRVRALADIGADTPGGTAVLRFLTAAAQAEADRPAEAAAGLDAIAANGDLPAIYRQIAAFKAVALQAETLPAAERRLRFEALAAPGAPLRLLAEEQLALIDIAEGQSDQAIERLQAILLDAEAGPALQRRASRVIVALGATPQLRPGQQG